MNRAALRRFALRSVGAGAVAVVLAAGPVPAAQHGTYTVTANRVTEGRQSYIEGEFDAPFPEGLTVEVVDDNWWDFADADRSCDSSTACHYRFPLVHCPSTRVVFTARDLTKTDGPWWSPVKVRHVNYVASRSCQ